MRRTPLLAITTALAIGCRSHFDIPSEVVPVDVPDAFSHSTGLESALDGVLWWTTFDAPGLDAAVDASLDGNLELEAAWARLAQANAAADAARAPRFPTVDLGASAQRFEIDQSGGGANQIPIRLGETYSLGPSLSYEIDLFGRIGAQAASARLNAEATRFDAHATALALTGRVTDAWLTAVENAALAALLDRQIETGEQLLDLTRTRFSNGAGSALDVLQQQRLLESTRAEAPRFLGALERAQNQLAVLAGSSPTGQLPPAPDALPVLPPFPDLDVPAALFEKRPDVVAAYLRIRSIDREVAAAIAARYPRLSLNASYNFDANEIELLWDRTISSIVANLTLPLIDGGSRRAEVRRQRARLDESVAAFGQAFLTSLQEVEDAISLERRGVERVEALLRQREISTAEAAQARSRYVGGAGTYLQVLTAVQNEQALDRLILTERAAVLRARAQLLRALGGAWQDTRDDRPIES